MVSQYNTLKTIDFRAGQRDPLDERGTIRSVLFNKPEKGVVYQHEDWRIKCYNYADGRPAESKKQIDRAIRLINLCSRQSEKHVRDQMLSSAVSGLIMSIDDQAGDAEKILNSVECAHNRLIDEIGTLSVYISSPYKDLLPYRLKAAKAVRELEYRPIGMEDYVACDERPLLKCLGDVQGSDVYVGILARRYGHRDPGDSISITHHEYRAAKDRDIPRLLFKLDPRCSWPKKFIDDDQSLVKEFVAEWEADRVVKTFTTPDDLGRAVATSLANLARSRTRH